MNPDDIATETIMPEAFLALAREMVAQKSPEAAATAALAWALRHAPVDGGCTLEVAGHRIERIAPEPDPWPTAPLIVADWTSGGVEGGRGLLYRETDADQYWTIRENESVYPEHSGDTLTNVVPVTVVPVAALPVLWSALEQWLNGNSDPGPDMNRLVGAVINLREQIDALGVDL